MSINLSYETIINVVQGIADILLVWLILYYIMKIVKTNQKTIQIFQGIVFILLLQAISNFFGLKTVNMLASNIVSWGVIALIVIFQPEIRSILERLGKSNAFARISTLSSSEKENPINELITATAQLSASKTGALITLEQAHSLSDYINTGIKINSVVSAELLCSIFMTTTPLHDGAVIIQGDKLASASAYFPPTTMDLPSRYGARHRAAIGISEISDAITIVVSEETGRVSVATQGKLLQMNDQKLRDYLEKVILNKEQLAGRAAVPTSKESVKVDSFVTDVEEDFKTSTPSKSDGDMLNNMNGHEMKNFETMSFKVVSDADEKDKSIVENVIDNAMNENKLDSTIVVKKVSVPKDTVSEKTGIIKTTSITNANGEQSSAKNKEEESDE